MRKDVLELIEKTRVQLIDLVDHAFTVEERLLVVADEWRNAPWEDLDGFNSYGSCWSKRNGWGQDDTVYKFKLNSKFSKYLSVGYITLDNPDVEKVILNTVVHEFTHGMRANRGGCGGHDFYFFKLAETLTRYLQDFYDVNVGEISRFVQVDETILIDRIDLMYESVYALVNEEEKQVVLYKKMPSNVKSIEPETRMAYNDHGYSVFKNTWQVYDLTEAGTFYDPNARYTRKSLLEKLESKEFKFYTKVK